MASPASRGRNLESGEWNGTILETGQSRLRRGAGTAAGVAGAAVGAVAANALADDKPTSTEQRVTQPDNEQQAVQAQQSC